jgi:hypothetical protein
MVPMCISWEIAFSRIDVLNLILDTARNASGIFVKWCSGIPKPPFRHKKQL